MIPLTNIPFYYNDGGRHYAGYKGTTGDCVCRALCIAEGLEYKPTYKMMVYFAGEYNQMIMSSGCSKRTKKTRLSHPRTGYSNLLTHQLFEKYGYTYVKLPKIGRRYHRVADIEDMLIYGTHILQMKKHVATCIDGKLFDSWDSREKIVLGYFTKTIDHNLVKVCKHIVMSKD